MKRVLNPHLCEYNIFCSQYLKYHLKLYNSNQHTNYILCPNTSSAYGATLIEHSLIEAGLSGSAKVDNQTNVAEGTGEMWLISQRTVNVDVGFILSIQ